MIFRITCLAADTADFEHLPEAVRPATQAETEQEGKDDEAHMSLQDLKRIASDAAERRFLERGLQEVGGRVSELAIRVDMNRSHLQTLLKKHGLRSKDYRAKS